MAVPDFVIIGAPKAGTTALDVLLGRVPGIQMAAVKEPRFFSVDVCPNYGFTPPVRSFESYKALWPSESGAPGVCRGEATANYLIDPGSAVRMAALSPPPRVIILMRDPRSRALSHFLYREKRTGHSDRSFSQAIRAEVDAPLADYQRSYLLLPGYYARHLAHWRTHLGHNKVLIIFFDELILDPKGVVRKCCEFLNVRQPALIETQLDSLERNAKSEPRWRWATQLMQSPTIKAALKKLKLTHQATMVGRRILLRQSSATTTTIAEKDRKFLEELYKEDSEKLCELLSQNPPWYNGTWAQL